MVPMTTFYNVTSPLCVSIDPYSERVMGGVFMFGHGYQNKRIDLPILIMMSL